MASALAMAENSIIEYCIENEIMLKISFYLSQALLANQWKVVENSKAVGSYNHFGSKWPERSRT